MPNHWANRPPSTGFYTEPTRKAWTGAKGAVPLYLREAAAQFAANDRVRLKGDKEAVGVVTRVDILRGQVFVRFGKELQERACNPTMIEKIKKPAKKTKSNHGGTS